MQKRDRKRYSREFKLEAVRRTQIACKSVAEVARELESPVHHLYKWRVELERKRNRRRFKRFRFIREHERKFRITTMCRLWRCLVQDITLGRTEA